MIESVREIKYPSLVRDVSEEKVAGKVAQEFLEKVRPITELRACIKESNMELTVLLREVIVKLDKLTELKGANAKEEAEVLDLLRKELHR